MENAPQHLHDLGRGSVVDGYRIVKSLGSGGFGSVFLVEKEGRRYAMKFALHRAESRKDDSQADARAQRELMCLLRVEAHPNVVRLYGHGHWPRPENGWLYILLEYVEGYTLAQWVRRMHPTPEQCVRLFAKLFSTLAALHSCGIHHRDLKVTNIMVRKNGEPVIIDFGAGHHAFAGELTDAPLPPGTERYRSPEAARFFYANKMNADARYEFKATDDIYALGLCLYDVLTSPAPERPQVSIRLKVSVPLPSPQAVNPRVPEPLSDIVASFIVRDPDDRPPTADVAKRLLESLLPATGEAWTATVHRLEDVMEADKRYGTVVQFPSVQGPAEDAPPEAPRWWRRGAAVAGVAAAGVILVMLWVFRVAPWEAASKGPESAPRAVSATQTDGQSARVLPLAMSLPAPTLPAPAPKEGLVVKSQPLAAENPAADTRKKAAQSEAPGSNRATGSVPKGRSASFVDFLKKCAVATGLVSVQLGCPSGGQSQLRPAPAECPAEAQDVMFRRLRDTGGLMVREGGSIGVSLDRNRRGGQSDETVYGDGPVQGYVEEGSHGLVEGTILFGQLWTGTGALVGRYTEALLPDGRRVPVCIAVGFNWDEVASGVPVRGEQGSKPGAVVSRRRLPGFPVSRWP